MRLIRRIGECEFIIPASQREAACAAAEATGLTVGPEEYETVNGWGAVYELLDEYGWEAIADASGDLRPYYPVSGQSSQDIYAVLDALAPFVEAGGMMDWVDGYGCTVVAEFDGRGVEYRTEI